MKYIVEVFEDKTGQVIKRIECASERQSDKVNDGLQINLDYERYTTRVVKEVSKQAAK